MYPKLYFPRFFPVSYEKAVQTKLNTAKLNRLAGNETESERCALLICLKRNVANASASFGQLKDHFFFDSKHLEMVRNTENELKKALALICEDKPIPQEQFESLTNTYNQLAAVKNSGWEKFSSSFNFSMASGVTVFSVVGIYYSAAMVYGAVATLAIGIGTGPIGLLAIGVALTCLFTVAALFMAYTVYAEARFLANKQLNEISECIDLLKVYSDELESDDVDLSQEGADDYLDPSNGVADEVDEDIGEEVGGHILEGLNLNG